MRPGTNEGILILIRIHTEKNSELGEVLRFTGDRTLQEEIPMKRMIVAICLVFTVAAFSGCAPAYKAKPLSFKAPTSYPNYTQIDGVGIGARAYVSPERAKEAFGFDIRAAGMLPVEIVFDNEGRMPLEIDGGQTFLEDGEGNLWPILSTKIAYERATKYAKTNQVFESGAYHGFLGATAGAILGAAIGIVSGENAIRSAGQGAALGGAAGAVLGGAGSMGSDSARRSIMQDLRDKSLQYRPIPPGGLSFGFLFFPGEAKTARLLRLKIREGRNGPVHVLRLRLYPQPQAQG